MGRGTAETAFPTAFVPEESPDFLKPVYGLLGIGLTLPVSRRPPLLLSAASLTVFRVTFSMRHCVSLTSIYPVYYA
jgi:hypothetical protein